MTHRHKLKAFDHTLRDMRRSTFLFGGTVILCLGDFRQISSVVRAANCAQIVGAFFKLSRLYSLIKYLHLH